MPHHNTKMQNVGTGVRTWRLRGPFASHSLSKGPESTGPAENLDGRKRYVQPPKGFIPVSPDQMSLCRAVFEEETVVKVASGIALAELLGGGMLFSVGNKTLTGSKAHDYQSKWALFAEDFLRSVWMYGFAAVSLKTDDTLGVAPSVLDLTYVQVYMRRDLTGEAEFIYFDARPETLEENGHPVLLQGLRTFERHRVNWNGELNSVAMTAYTRRQTLTHLEQAEKAAVAQNANPLMVLQDTRPQQDLSATHEVVAGTSVPHPSRWGGTAARRSDFTHLIGKVANDMAKIQAYIARTNEQYDPDAKTDVLNELAHRHPLLAAASDSKRANPTRYLPQGYQVASGVNQPQEPTNLVPMMESFEELVGALFFVPRSMWAQFSASRSANNPDARLMFQEGQRYLKQYMVTALTQVFAWSHGEQLRKLELASLINEAYQELRRFRAAHAKVVRSLRKLSGASLEAASDELRARERSKKRRKVAEDAESTSSEKTVPDYVPNSELLTGPASGEPQGGPFKLPPEQLRVMIRQALRTTPKSGYPLPQGNPFLARVAQTSRSQGPAIIDVVPDSASTRADPSKPLGKRPHETLDQLALSQFPTPNDTEWEVTQDELDAQTALSSVMSDPGLDQKLQVHVSLVGLPPEDRLEQWNETGLIKHEKYVETLARIHNMPLSFFNVPAPVLPPHVKLALVKPQTSSGSKK